MSLNSLRSEAAKLHSEGSYLQAVETITEGIKNNSEDGDLFLLRGQNLLKLDKFKEAARDAEKAIKLGVGTEAYLLHGKALFNIGTYEAALETFIAGKKVSDLKSGGFDQVGQWITWCEDRIQKNLKINNTNNSEPLAGKMEECEVVVSTPNTKPAITDCSKIKHDWYQTESHVCINILCKGRKQEEVCVDFTETTVIIAAKLGPGSEYNLELDLCHAINVSQSSFKVLTSKIEIKLKKQDCIRWSNLERDGTNTSIKTASIDSNGSKNPPQYPTSASKKRDWNKIEAQVKKEEESEKLEGDAALNQLFQKIYADANEETRRAMNKSFMESGGTVLSTNWKEVGAEKVEVKPPDGVEYKKWDA